MLRQEPKPQTYYLTRDVPELGARAGDFVVFYDGFPEAYVSRIVSVQDVPSDAIYPVNGYPGPRLVR